MVQQSSGELASTNPTTGAVTLLKEEREKSALAYFQAAATAARHVSIAAARKARCVGAEVRWRWT
jgi:hypothetical protein